MKRTKIILFFFLMVSLLFIGKSSFVFGQPTLGTSSFAISGTTTLLTNAVCTGGRSANVAGYTFAIFSALNCAMNNSNAGGDDGRVNMIASGAGGYWLEGRIASSDGSEFQLDNFNFVVLTASFVGGTVTINGYKDGVIVPGATATSSIIAGTGNANINNINVTANTAFDNIDEFRLSHSSPIATGTLSIMDITISGSLPIALINWGSKRNSFETIQLNWQTTSETNNKGFEVQKSTDAENFSTIAYMEGKGNSAIVNNYELLWMDNSIAAHYRLKQIDYDGKVSYSKLIYQEGAGSKVKIYPNPVRDHIEFIGEETVNYQVFLSDILGNTIENHSGSLIQVGEIISKSLSRIPNGIYLLKFYGGGEWQVQRFVKVD